MTKRFLLPAEFAESFPGIVLFIFLQLFSQNISLTQLPKHIFQIPIVQHFPKFLLFPFLQCPGIIFSQKSNLSVKFIFLHLKKRSILFAGIRKKNNCQMIIDNCLEALLPLENNKKRNEKENEEENH